MTLTISKRIIAGGTFVIAAILLTAGIGQAQTAAASKEYKRLVNLGVALSKIPIEKQNKEPHRSFLKRNDNDIVYSEPAGQWYVRAVRFWDLQAKYSGLKIADQIAWTAAGTMLPGECEGYVNCYLYNLRATYGEYLRLYPKGTYSRKAVQKYVRHLSFMADDIASGGKNYEGPMDATDRAEFTKLIIELREILAKVSHPEKTKALSQLKQIEEGFK